MTQYIVIVKAGKDHFVKYHVKDLIKFTSFIDKKFPDWRFFNVFDKEKGTQIANFTTKNKPTKSRVNDYL